MEYEISPESHVDSFGSVQRLKIVGDNINGHRKRYFLRIELSGTNGSFDSEASVDYLSINRGDLFFKSNASYDVIDFDVNEYGELVIIGEDADNFYINENGELIYIEPSTAFAKVGLLSENEPTDMTMGLSLDGEIGKSIQLEK